MARIPLPAPEIMTPDQRRVYDAIVSGPRKTLVGPLRAALHIPELADKWQQFGELLRYRTSLPPRLSELAILVTARHTNSQLEWFIHEQTARTAGLEDAVIASVKKRERPQGADADVLAIYDYARELNERDTVSGAVHKAVAERFKVAGVVELTALIGYYTMVAMTLNAHEIPLPDGAKPPLD